MTSMEKLLSIMAQLRDPDHGCPWDRKQTFETIAPYTIEEAYEVVDAIRRDDHADLRDELGDLLLQVVYHSRIAEEAGLFTFGDVAAAICAKMIRRHPHVFGAASLDGDAHAALWETIKNEERAAKRADKTVAGLFDDIPAGFPGLLRAAKLQKRARAIGFDWPSVAPVFEKLAEEIGELESEVAENDKGAHDRRVEEFGDVMFVLVNLSLHLGIDAEAALRAANSKFANRMNTMATAAGNSGRQLEGMSLEDMEKLWQEAKLQEK